MVKGRNNCSWSIDEAIDYCGKPCANELCKQHRVQIIRGQNQTYPHRNCDASVISVSTLFPRCGASRMQHKLAYTQKRAPIAFRKVFLEFHSVI